MTEVKGEPRFYEDQFPPEAGPPRVPNNTGTKLLDATKPHYTVDLDSGAFRALWELLEAEARHRFPAAPGISGYRAYLRAVESFRDAYWSQNGNTPAPLEPAPSRRLKRPKRG
jgi:hypothetical protein